MGLALQKITNAVEGGPFIELWPSNEEQNSRGFHKFKPGLFYDVEYKIGKIIIKYNPFGKRKVSVRKRRGWKQSKCVFDIRNKQADKALEGYDGAKVNVYRHEIHIIGFESHKRQVLNQKAQWPLRALELFAGGGTLSKTAEECGIDVVAVVEIDEDFTEVYMKNHKNTYVYNLPLQNIDPNDFPEVDAVFAGIPCNDFSRIKVKKTRKICKQFICHIIF